MCLCLSLREPPFLHTEIKQEQAHVCFSERMKRSTVCVWCCPEINKRNVFASYVRIESPARNNHGLTSVMGLFGVWKCFCAVLSYQWPTRAHSSKGLKV
jgi:hypothetical protein